MSKLIEKEGKHYIQGKVVMLATKDQTYQVKEGGLFINDTRKHSWGKLEALRCERVTQHGHSWNGTGIRTDICHLYITSDDGIKEGDWVYYKNGSLEGIHQVINGQRPKTMILKKIIATTDELKLKDISRPLGVYQILPSPSENFIKAYIEAYNNGNVIEDILIEVEEIKGDLGIILSLTNEDFKLKLKDNNIIIKKVKDSWSRDEVCNLLNEYRVYTWKTGSTAIDLTKWIEENL
jgi:hypothetical protein